MRSLCPGRVLSPHLPAFLPQSVSQSVSQQTWETCYMCAKSIAESKKHPEERDCEAWDEGKATTLDGVSRGWRGRIRAVDHQSSDPLHKPAINCRARTSTLC